MQIHILINETSWCLIIRLIQQNSMEYVHSQLYIKSAEQKHYEFKK